ncbi:helix-turn-helix Fis-type [Patulibacter medicamentivorans]|uniref:Helix-turn-helix Fis-type n=1 Tax=Patulibacter medicamentivorans TaxID=1097667 RepID=H0EA05_9ACTN|nr:MarR family transcriptional regulator [Patulibacter medicamentivorans]EHN09486.1 helix-turn-helix Fis-type [Patulibacter medicamentivorans]
MPAAPDPYRTLDDGPDEAAAGPELRAVRDQLVRLFRATKRIRGHGNQHLQGGLSIPQFHLVEPLLHSDEPLPVGRLAELAATTPPTATTMIRKLEDQGLIERSADAGDRRVVRVALTSAGRAVVDERRQRVAAWRLRVAAAVPEADRETGARVLSAIADELERAADELAALSTDSDGG